MVTLTICIPTYNRINSLKECLVNLEKQKFTKNVQVIISDNASTDGTQAFVKKYISSAPFRISYLRNTKNLGFDQNVLNLYQAATTDYVWFLSDDDTMLPNSLSHIWRLLNKYQPTALHPNVLENGNTVLSDNHFAQLTHYSKKIGFHINTDKVMHLRTSTDRMVLTRLLSFISCCIVKKENQIVPDLKAFVGSGILQDAIVSLNLQKTPTVLISRQPSISSGSKPYFSYWFMDSLFFGTYQLYSNKKLQFPSHLVQLLGRDIVLFGLNLMANPKNIVKYHLDQNQVFILCRTYQFGAILFLPPLIKIFLNYLLRIKPDTTAT